jgi:Condensation domain
VTDRVIVPFEGDGSGIEELSWGQQEIWSVMRRMDSPLPMGGARALPPGQAVADVVAGLAFIMGRHQSLRTTLRFGPDGQVWQVVHASGEIALEVVDAGDRDPGEVAEAVAAGQASRTFDYENDWPLRMAVITRRGVATHIAEAICHLALDAFGLAALHDDFDHRDERTGPVTALQPMEQARRQRSPGARRAHEASIRYFERLAAGIPDRQFSESADPREPQFWQLTCESPAGYRAARKIAVRLSLGTSPVLLAAFAVALTSITVPSGRVAFHLVVNNRFRPGLAGSVSPVMGSCLCVIEVAGIPFEEVVGRAWKAALGAYKHAYYGLAGKEEACERIAAERGSEPDWQVVFNDRRVRSRDLADIVSADSEGDPSSWPPPLPEELSRTTLTWGERNDMPQEKVSLNICEAPGTLCYEVRADTRFVSPADMAGLLRRIESVLVDAAFGGGTGDEDGAKGEARTAATTGTVR